MRNTKQAFTLVELIVVITILAILGTIAFISLQGYSAEARNAKRTSDLSSVASSLSVKLTNGMSVLSAVGSSVNRNAAESIAGSGTVDAAFYNAGVINYTSLEMKESEFQDPDGPSYVIGATTLAGGVYQLAATVESDGNDAALVTGMYVARGTGTVTGTINSGVFRVAITDTGKFKFNDTVDVGTFTGLKVTKVSSDGQSITVNSTTATGTTIALSNAEDAGLIADKDTLTDAGIITDGGVTNLPY